VDEQEYRIWAQNIAAGDVRGTGVFYASPVYPYFLAGVFRLFDPDLFAPRVIQALLGAACAPLAAALAVTLGFGATVGVVTGVFVGLYRTTAFYDLFLLKESLALFIQGAALLVVAIALRRLEADARGARTGVVFTRETTRAIFAAGAFVGLTALAREYLAPLLIAIAALVAVRAWSALRGGTRARGSAPGHALASPRAWSAAARAVALFVAGAALVLVPIALRNLIVGGEFVLLSSQGGQNFYLGNSLGNQTGLVTFPANVRSDPMTLEQDFRALAEHRAGRPLGPSEASSFWLRESLREMASDPAHAVKLFGRKALLSVSAFEVPNVLSIGYFERLSRSLAFNPIRFGLVFPLAMLGIAVTLRDPALRRAAILPLIVLAAVFLALVAFYVSDRYRLPAIAPLSLFAAVACVAAYRFVRGGAWRAHGHATRLAAAGAAVFALAAVVSRLPTLPPGSRGDAMPPANLGNSLAKEGRLEDAIARYQEAFAIEPDTDFALYGIAVVYGDLGRHAEAIASFRKYIEKNPNSAQAYYSLGNTYFEMGHPDTAIMAFQAAVQLEPYYAEAYFNMGAVKQGLGDLPGAIDAYERALRTAPGLARAWNNLGMALIATGRSAEGAAALERALADTTYIEPRMNLADFLLRQGRADPASQLYNWVLAREKRHDALLGYARARLAAGDSAGARTSLELYLRVAPPAERTEADSLLRALLADKTRSGQ
jgi:Tfp pilus assembly protein PilF